MTLEFPAVTLTRYAERIGYRSCAFWGIRHVDDPRYECRDIWTKSQRDMIAWALLEAQEEIEQEIGYFLVPRWVTNERQSWGPVVRARWGMVIEAGIMSDTMLEAGAAVDYTADPALVMVSVGTCATGDIHVFHAGTDTEIVPTSLSIAGGLATISIPWCRLVDPAFADNPPDGWDYVDVATWGAATVDVRCIANDASTQATLICRHACTMACSLTGCQDQRHTACIYVRDERLGHLDVKRADYASGTWTAKCLECVPQWVLLNYRAGLTPITRQAEDVVIRLAHAKMPSEPCGCRPTQILWERDRNVPEMLTRERINCPFGQAGGAWWAWCQAQRMKPGRAGVI